MCCFSKDGVLLKTLEVRQSFCDRKQLDLVKTLICCCAGASEGSYRPVSPSSSEHSCHVCWRRSTTNMALYIIECGVPVSIQINCRQINNTSKNKASSHDLPPQSTQSHCRCQIKCRRCRPFCPWISVWSHVLPRKHRPVAPNNSAIAESLDCY